MCPLTENDIASIGQLLASNEAVRHHIASLGRLHIDRQLPFLAVYRRPVDRVDQGTDRLLFGEASYLVVQDISNWHEQLKSLVATVVKTQFKVFGAYILLEIWAGSYSGSGHDAPEFKIFAPRKESPGSLLEKFESALLRVSINNLKANVAINFTDSVAPPDLEPLIPDKQLTDLGCLHLGLEVKPIYSNQQSVLFPFELKALQQQLSRALKRLFYEFTLLNTTHRPAHYHELGRRTMTQVVRDTDRELAAISNEFDLLLHVTPVNVPIAWEQFKKNNFRGDPDFLYRARPIDPGLLKRQLYKIPLEHIEDPTLAHIFYEKREELDRQITLVADRNTSRFLLGSRQLYGDTGGSLLQLAKDILQNLIVEDGDQAKQETISATEFHKRACEEILFYQQQDSKFRAKVELRDDVSGIMVSHGNFLIGSDTRISKTRIKGSLAHEVSTHMLTYHNGRQQPLQEFYAGMAGYESMQEGLAVLGEYLTGELNPLRLRLLAARVLAVKCITDGADFCETFKIINREYGFDHRNAFYISMRVFRGGGFTKDIVYLKGLIEILKYLALGKELEPLYLGKISHEHLSLIQELQWRKVLQPPSLRPRFLDTLFAKSRLKKLQQGLTVLNLVEVDE